MILFWAVFFNLELWGWVVRSRLVSPKKGRVWSVWHCVIWLIWLGYLNRNTLWLNILLTILWSIMLAGYLWIWWRHRNDDDDEPPTRKKKWRKAASRAKANMLARMKKLRPAFPVRMPQPVGA